MLGRARTDLLLPHQLYHPLHLCHSLHHLDLKPLMLVDAYSQLMSSLRFLVVCLYTSVSRASQAAWMSTLDERENEGVVIPYPRLLT